MKNRILFILVLVLALFFYSEVSASETCSPKGYTIATINGIFNTEKQARKNKDELKNYFSDNYNNQPLTVDFFYNPTHLAGVGDFVDAIQQGVFNQKSDYDLVEMLDDASQKVTTQKLLLVAHSQGNFYANNFYDKTASQPGGIPKESMGVYGVGSPANFVAGGGKYLTSDTDDVIARLVANYIKILSPNIHIPIQKSADGNGHSFSGVYLKYKGDRIVSDIKSSLNKLKENDEQESDGPCISPPELTLGHKIIGGVFVVADPTAKVVKKGVVGAYDASKYASNKMNLAFSSFINSIKKKSDLALNNGASVLEGAQESLDALKDAREKTAEADDSSVPKETLPVENTPDENTPPILPDTSDLPNTDSNTEPEKKRSGGGGRGVEENIEIETPVVPGDNEIPEEDPVVPEPEPAPTCIDPQILVDNVCADPVSESEPDPVPDPIPDPEPEPIPEPEEPPIELETITISENTVLLAGEYDYDNLIITNNAVLTLEGNPESTDDFKGVKINVVNLTINKGASISADQKGYGPNQGPGAIQDTSAVSNLGAGYGGASSSSGVTYGSATEPIDLGSGGAGLNHGGGAIYIVVSDTFTNDGIISSSGGASSSGGSIYMKAGKIEGSGIFRANGGDLYQTGFFKSPGGGGRVALYYDDWSFDGIVEAKGGCGSYDSYTKVCSGDGTAGVFDLRANDFYAKGSWKFLKGDNPFNFNHIFLMGAKVEIEDEVEIVAEDIVLDESAVLVLSGEETINADNLLVTGNSTITVLPEKILSLIISNITVDLGSTISADEKGYINGPGTEGASGAGASYGGKGGGASAKPSYGSDTEPTDFGSGGEGHRGGGAIRLEVENNLQNNGIISASGIKDRVSGGSIFITADGLSGDGIFQAYGGNSSWPYGPIAGGGGRIAVYYKTVSFSGTTNVLGGVYCYSGCNSAAESGTVVMVDESIVVDPEPEPDPIPDPLPEPDPIPVCVDPQILVDNICTDPEPTPEPESEPEPTPDPVPDITTPSITSYSFNGVEDDVTINSLDDVTTMVFIANKNVDWVSIKIEKEDDESIFKSLRESALCADGTDTCTKTWDSLLAGDTTAPNGIYKVKVRIRDLSDNTKDYDYFSPYTITVNTSRE